MCRLLPVLALVAVVGCQCSDSPVNPISPCQGVEGADPDHPKACVSSDECGDHFSCTSVKDRDGLQCCMFADRKCNTEADCCPGQTCPADRRECFDKFLECETDADCGDSGDRFCELWEDSYGTSSRCRFKACGALGECPEGQACFQGECMAGLPCGGQCEAGKACVPTIDRCQDYACPTSCAPGFIATFSDSRNIWDSCNLPTVACECAELPPLRSEDVGRFSAIATTSAPQKAVYVSLYDGQYGDLVVNRYETDGRLARQDYVDGVPANAAAKYGPSGARGGVTDPGPDVGRYTDVATHGDQVYVSYFDATNGDLKLAIRQGDGSWSTVRVDGADADLGLYTSLAVDADGFPVISYFQRGGDAAFNPAACPGTPPTGDRRFISALKLARATSANPGPNDFTTTFVACQSRPPPACFGCSDTCADPGTGPACFTAATTCTGCDANTETCVLVNGTATCAKKYNPSELNAIPDGVGLFSSVVTDGKDAVIAYMRRTDGKGALETVRVSGSGAVSGRVVLDAAGDTGYFPALARDPSTRNYAVAWHDFSSRKLKFLFAPNLTAGLSPEIIDHGAGAPGSGDASWVGTDVALTFAPNGTVFAAYQDATRGDLKVAARKAGWEPLTPARTEGAVGFFADAAFLGQTLYMSHARIHAKLLSGEPRVDNTLLLDRINVP
ncbi:MAG: hypothetical protein WBV82_20145 [Myxococcaceae bacterium]